MPSLIAYRKTITAINTFELRLPESAPGQRQGQEIATLADGRTVVVLDDGATLPTDQPAQIAPSIETLPSPLPVDVRDTIRAASPHVRLIDQRVVDKIRELYSINDEIKLLRIAPSAETTAWNDHVEACRAWGRAEKAKLGL
jgi:hypothetical protein